MLIVFHQRLPALGQERADASDWRILQLALKELLRLDVEVRRPERLVEAHIAELARARRVSVVEQNDIAPLHAQVLDPDIEVRPKAIQQEYAPVVHISALLPEGWEPLMHEFDHVNIRGRIP